MRPSGIATVGTKQVTPSVNVHADGILRRRIKHPIYSTVGVASGAFPSVLEFFAYQRGQAVPGAGNGAGGTRTANLFHTNLRISGHLGAPQVFTWTGVAVELLPLGFATAHTPSATTLDPSQSGTVGASDLLQDLLLMFWSTRLEVIIGSKTYIDHPLHFFPSQRSYQGIAAQDLDTTADAANLQDVTMPDTIGQTMPLDLAPLTIETAHPISVRLHRDHASWNMSADRLIRCTLLGFLDVEVS